MSDPLRYKAIDSQSGEEVELSREEFSQGIMSGAFKLRDNDQFSMYTVDGKPKTVTAKEFGTALQAGMRLESSEEYLQRYGSSRKSIARSVAAGAAGAVDELSLGLAGYGLSRAMGKDQYDALVKGNKTATNIGRGVGIIAPIAASVFTGGATGAAAVGKEGLKQGGKAVLKQGGKQVLKEGLEQGAVRVGKELLEEGIEQGGKGLFQIAKGAAARTGQTIAGGGVRGALGATPLGALSNFSDDIARETTKAILGKGKNTAARRIYAQAMGGLAAGAVDGATVSTARAIGKAALGDDPEYTLEAALWDIGAGTLFGATAGGVLGGSLAGIGEGARGAGRLAGKGLATGARAIGGAADGALSKLSGGKLSDAVEELADDQLLAAASINPSAKEEMGEFVFGKVKDALRKVRDRTSGFADAVEMRDVAREMYQEASQRIGDIIDEVDSKGVQFSLADEADNAIDAIRKSTRNATKATRGGVVRNAKKHMVEVFSGTLDGLKAQGRTIDLSAALDGNRLDDITARLSAGESFSELGLSFDEIKTVLSSNDIAANLSDIKNTQSLMRQISTNAQGPGNVAKLELEDHFREAGKRMANAVDETGQLGNAWNDANAEMMAVAQLSAPNPKTGGWKGALERTAARVENYKPFSVSSLPGALTGVGAVLSGAGLGTGAAIGAAGAFATKAWNQRGPLLLSKALSRLPSATLKFDDTISRAITNLGSRVSPLKVTVAVPPLASVTRALEYPVTDHLADRIFADLPERDRKKPKKHHYAYARYKELQHIVSNPMEYTQIANSKMSGVAREVPEIANGLINQGLKAAQYVLDKAPKPSTDPLGREIWRTPSDAKLAEFAQIYRAAMDPSSVLADLAEGKLSFAAAKTFRELYPAAHTRTTVAIMEALQKGGINPDYPTLTQLSLLFGAPLHDTLRPEFVQRLQGGAEGEEGEIGAQANAGPTAPGRGAGGARLTNIDNFELKGSRQSTAQSLERIEG